MARTYGKAQDLIDFTRASSGTCLRRVKYGAELVTNGTFDSDTTGWTADNSTVSWNTGALQLYVTGSAVGSAYQAFSVEAGKQYLITGVIEVLSSASTSNISLRTGSDAGSGFIYQAGFQGGVGVSNVYGIYQSDQARTVYLHLRTFNGVDTTTLFDNISVKEVTLDTSDGDLILFNHPNNVPRIEYDADGNLLGLLVEESRTNLVTYSEDFTQWDASSNGTGLSPIITNGFVSPSGKTDASKIVFDTGAGTTSSDKSMLFDNFSCTPSVDYSGSVWLKGEVGGEEVVIRHVGAVGYTKFTLTNEWARYSAIESAYDSAGSIEIGIRQGLAGIGTINSSATVYVYGAQVEQGSFPTSYIPTSGSTATRSADVASIGVDGFGYNSSEGSVVVEFDAADTLTNKRLFSLNDGTVDNRIDSLVSGSYVPNLFVMDNSVNQVSVNTSNSYTTGEVSKIGVGYKLNDYGSVLDGGTVATDTSASVPTITQINVGTSTVANWLNGHIKSIKYYPRRLLNSQLQELTS